MITMRSRYEGAILGLAIGDALGWPVEFLSLDAIRAQYGPNGVANLVPSGCHPAGMFTDDTQMSLAIAQAILSKGQGPESVFISEVVREFVVWSLSPENDRAPGATCMTACRELACDPTWRAPEHDNSKGCGTATAHQRRRRSRGHRLRPWAPSLGLRPKPRQRRCPWTPASSPPERAESVNLGLTD